MSVLYTLAPRAGHYSPPLESQSKQARVNVGHDQPRPANRGAAVHHRLKLRPVDNQPRRGDNFRLNAAPMRANHSGPVPECLCSPHRVTVGTLFGFLTRLVRLVFLHPNVDFTSNSIAYSPEIQ